MKPIRLTTKAVALWVTLTLILSSPIGAGDAYSSEEDKALPTYPASLAPTEAFSEGEIKADASSAFVKEWKGGGTDLGDSANFLAESEEPLSGVDEEREGKELSHADLEKIISDEVFSKYTLSLQSNDPYWYTSGSFRQDSDDLWGLKKIGVEEAWNINTGIDIRTGQPITVAVIDTGVDYNHPDLDSNIWTNPGEIPGDGIDNDGNGFVDDWRGWNWVGNTNDPLDDHGHGTHVAGIIAAEKDNGIGGVGVAPDARIMPLKVLDEGSSGTFGNILRGIYYAASQGARVINLSLGIAARFWPFLPVVVKKAFNEVIHYATKVKKVIIVAAAGNNAARNFLGSETSYPAALSGVLAVGATTPDDTRANFSNAAVLDFIKRDRKKTEFIAAPGFNIVSTWTDDRYALLSGTSMATPFVAGAIALILGRYPRSTRSEVMDRLRLSAKDLGKKGFDDEFGWGLLDVAGALKVASETVQSGPVGAGQTILQLSSGPLVSTGGLSPLPRFLNFGARDGGYFKMALFEGEPVISRAGREMDGQGQTALTGHSRYQRTSSVQPLSGIHDETRNSITFSPYRGKSNVSVSATELTPTPPSSYPKASEPKAPSAPVSLLVLRLQSLQSQIEWGSLTPQQASFELAVLESRLSDISEAKREEIQTLIRVIKQRIQSLRTENQTNAQPRSTEVTAPLPANPDQDSNAMRNHPAVDENGVITELPTEPRSVNSSSVQ